MESIATAIIIAGFVAAVPLCGIAYLLQRFMERLAKGPIYMRNHVYPSPELIEALANFRRNKPRVKKTEQVKAAE